MMGRTFIQAALLVLLTIEFIHISQGETKIAEHHESKENLTSEIKDLESRVVREAGRKQPQGRKIYDIKTNKNKTGNKKRTGRNKKQSGKKSEKGKHYRRKSIKKNKSKHHKNRLNKKKNKSNKIKGKRKRMQNVKKSKINRRKIKQLMKKSGQNSVQRQVQECNSELIWKINDQNNNIVNNLKQLRRVRKFCDLMEKKANKVDTIFEQTIETLTNALNSRTKNSRSIQLSRSTEQLTSIRDTLVDCKTTVKQKCEKSSVNICKKETEALLNKCELQLQGWLTKFKSCFDNSATNYWSCVTNVLTLEVSSDCLEFKDKSVEAANSKKECITETFRICKQEQDKAADLGIYIEITCPVPKPCPTCSVPEPCPTCSIPEPCPTSPVPEPCPTCFVPESCPTSPTPEPEVTCQSCPEPEPCPTNEPISFTTLPPVTNSNTSKIEESVLTMNENGQEIKQNNSFNEATGILTIDVPPHITLLGQNFTRSTLMYHAESNIMMIKTNSTCMLSDIPDYINATGMQEYFHQLKEGTVVWNNTNKEIVYDMKKIKHIVGPEERKKLPPNMDDLCNNEIITKTETKKINESQYKKLVNGEIVFTKQKETQRQKRSMCSAETACTEAGANSCSYWGWTNPGTGDGISFHQVSANAFCVTCCVNNGPLCNCTEEFPNICACSIITDKNSLQTCRLKSENYTIRFEDSNQMVGTQSLTYNNKLNERSIKIHVPSHGNNEEITVLMHSHVDGWWHENVYDGVLNNNMVLKLGSQCHIQTIPRTIFPIDIATRMQFINESNFILKPINEKRKYSIILNDNSLIIRNKTELNPEIRELCKYSKLLKHQEIEISQEEFDILDNGGIIDTTNNIQREECSLQTRAISLGSGCWRWNNPKIDPENEPENYPESGTLYTVHGLVHSVIQVSCCMETSGHHSTYCNCQDIVDRTSFEHCRAVTDKMVVIGGAHGTTKYNLYERFIRDTSSAGFKLKSLDPSTFPAETIGGIGAWIDNNLMVCPGYNGVAEDNCFMAAQWYESWTKFSTTILTDPLQSGGASAKYKSGPIGNEPGETWWIIGGDRLGTGTQEWNSVEGANPWDTPVLPQKMNTPCMVAIGDREIFVTAIPQGEDVETNKAWIFSRDYEDNGGWKTIPSLLEKRSGAACGFLPKNPFNRFGFIVVAGGRDKGQDKSSTEYLDVADCVDKNWNCAWVRGPDLGSIVFGASMVTFEREYLVLTGNHTDILAIDSGLRNWEVVGQTSQPRYDAVALTIQI